MAIIYNGFCIENLVEWGGRIFNNKACRMCHDTTFKRFRQKMVNCACKSKRRRRGKKKMIGEEHTAGRVSMLQRGLPPPPYCTYNLLTLQHPFNVHIVRGIKTSSYRYFSKHFLHWRQELMLKTNWINPSTTNSFAEKNLSHKKVYPIEIFTKLYMPDR